MRSAVGKFFSTCVAIAALFWPFSFAAWSTALDLGAGIESGAPQVIPTAVLTVKEYAEVKTRRISMSEVVACAGSRIICDELYGVDVGSAPEVGKVFRLEKAALKELVKSEWPTAQVQFEGSEFTKITSVSLEIGGREIERALQAKIDSSLASLERVKVSVEAAHLNRPIRFAGSSVRIAFPELTLDQSGSLQRLVRDFSGTKRLLVEFRDVDSEEALSTAKISFSLTVKALVLVAARDLRRGSTIGPDAVIEKWQLVGHEQELPLTSMANLNAYTLKRGLNADDPLKRSYLVVPDVLRRGQIVKVLLRNGDLEIVSKGKANADGGPGDVIDITLLGNQKHATATILNQTEVLLQ